VSTNAKGPFQLFYEYLYVIVIVTSVAVIAAYFITESMEPQYRSQARTYLPNSTDTVSLTSEAGNVPNSPLLPTANPDFQASLLGILAAADTRILVATKIPERNSEWLKKNVEFAIDRHNLITITAFDPDAAMAYQVANEYLRAFHNKIDESTKDRAKERSDTFVQGIKDSSAQLESLEQQRLDFMRANGAIDFSSEITELASRQTRYQDQIRNTSTTLAGLEEQRVTMQALWGARPETSESSSTVVTNPQLEELNRSLSSAKRERMGLLLQLKPNHPTVMAKEQEITALGAEVSSLEATIRGSATLSPDTIRADLDTRMVDLDLHVARSTKEAELYIAALAETKARRLELSILQIELETMEVEIKNLRTILTNYRDRKAELGIYLARTPTFMITPEYPTEASSPYLPILWVNLLVSAVLGMSFAIVLVLIMSQAQATQEENLW